MLLFNAMQVLVFFLAVNLSNDRWNVIEYCSDETSAGAAAASFLAAADPAANEVSHECANPLYTVAERTDVSHA